MATIKKRLTIKTLSDFRNSKKWDTLSPVFAYKDLLPDGQYVLKPLPEQDLRDFEIIAPFDQTRSYGLKTIFAIMSLDLDEDSSLYYASPTFVLPVMNANGLMFPSEAIMECILEQRTNIMAFVAPVAPSLTEVVKEIHADKRTTFTVDEVMQVKEVVYKELISFLEQTYSDSLLMQEIVSAKWTRSKPLGEDSPFKNPKKWLFDFIADWFLLDVDQDPAIPVTPQPRKRKTPLEKLMGDSKLKMPTIDEDGFYVSEEHWWQLASNFSLGEHTLLKGDTGSGKTELVKMFYAKAGMPLFIKDMGTMFDPQSSLLGSHRFKNGSVFDYAAYVSELQTENAGILFDELSRARPEANNILFPQLDNRRTLYVEITDSEHNRQIPVHDSVRFFATANIGNGYTGTVELDEALENRFEVIELGYLPEDIEAEVLRKRTNVEVTQAKQIAKLAAELRHMHANEDLSKPISTRLTLRIAKKVHFGFPLVKAVGMVLFPLFEGSATEGERAKIYSAIQKF